jgi:hypothetical protein
MKRVFIGYVRKDFPQYTKWAKDKDGFEWRYLPLFMTKKENDDLITKKKVRITIEEIRGKKK